MGRSYWLLRLACRLRGSCFPCSRSVGFDLRLCAHGVDPRLLFRARDGRVLRFAGNLVVGGARCGYCALPVFAVCVHFLATRTHAVVVGVEHALRPSQAIPCALLFDCVLLGAHQWFRCFCRTRRSTVCRTLSLGRFRLILGPSLRVTLGWTSRRCLGSL